eukprot:TRINITY_DN25635_c0_g1_i1.p1 TRINITY_DN25635_c0_g1~~TRINITY_DN25635_c0_g1_i1.p1  ORF type:complete len:441 (+),score=42.39 TRINITY_DN25635_c0_g1_i1:135-1457(+)
MRCLTYEWGSRNHMTKGDRSSEPPDDKSLASVGAAMRKAAGKDRKNSWWYPLGKITDVVYYVDGGMEDWSYGAGWEASPNPVTQCSPTTYGGYAKEKSVYKKGSIATAVYLAEMDDAKTPIENTLGNQKEVWTIESNQGHIARNMRMCLKVIELAKPEVIVRPTQWQRELKDGETLAIDFRPAGCLTLSFASLILVPLPTPSGSREQSCANTDSLWTTGQERELLISSAIIIGKIGRPETCPEFSVWETNPVYTRISGTIAELRPGTSYCAMITSEFDQDWAQQSHPDPNVKPRTHAARSRLEDHYVAEASQGSMRIDEYRVKLFSAYPHPMAMASAQTQEVPASPTTPVATPGLTPAATSQQDHSTQVRSPNLRAAKLQEAERRVLLLTVVSFICLFLFCCGIGMCVGSLLLSNRGSSARDVKTARVSELASMVGSRGL